MTYMTGISLFSYSNTKDQELKIEQLAFTYQTPLLYEVFDISPYLLQYITLYWIVQTLGEHFSPFFLMFGKVW